MPSVTTASGSVKGSDVLLAIQRKLVKSILVTDSNNVDHEVPTSVRITTSPNPAISQYKAEKGLALKFKEPNPETTAGGGRGGFPVTRTLEVYVFTQNLSDSAGDDEKLAVAHLDYEEEVIDVLHDARPVTLQLTTGERVGIKVRFIPGGAEIERDVKRDVGMALSILLFEVTYQLPFNVLRD